MSDSGTESTPFQRVSWPVRTEHLLLRPLDPDDFPRLYEIRAIPEVTHWLTGRPDSLEAYIERYGTPERLASTLVMEIEGTIIGDLYLGVEAPYAQVEVRERAEGSLGVIGWLLDPAYAGHGYATEAAAEMLRICFEELGLRRVVAGAFADNAASLRVSEKLGYRPDGVDVVARRGQRAEDVRLVVEPASLARPGWTLQVEGVEGCRELLGAR